MAYVDYTFYTDEYKGVMPFADFEKYSIEASREIDIATFDRASTALATMAIKVKLATCTLADLLLLQNEINTKTDNGKVSGFSNDGYSESFADSKQLSESFEKDKNKIFKDFLSFPINLIYRGL